MQTEAQRSNLGRLFIGARLRQHAFSSIASYLPYLEQLPNNHRRALRQHLVMLVWRKSNSVDLHPQSSAVARPLHPLSMRLKQSRIFKNPVTARLKTRLVGSSHFVHPFAVLLEVACRIWTSSRSWAHASLMCTLASTAHLPPA
jgi:hypothetical protein